MVWDAFVAAVRGARKLVALAGVLACASAQAVVYSGLSVDPPGGVVGPDGTLQVKFNYKVSELDPPGFCGGAVVKVELRELDVFDALATDTYTPIDCPNGDPEYLDELRMGALVTALKPGSHELFLRFYTKFNGGTYGTNSQPPITVVVTGGLPDNDAKYVRQTVPATMVVGRAYNVSVTMSNTGSNAWGANSSYKLGSANSPDSLWGLNRVVLDSKVVSGADKAINFSVTAPTTPGNYNFQWRMIKEGVEWFGQSSANAAVRVVAKPELTVTREPSPLIAGEGYKLTWTSKNATKVEYNCTASGTGYVGSGQMPTTSGTSNGVADKAWIGFPSTCTWTATGEGDANTTVVVETMTTNAPVNNAALVLQTVVGIMDPGKPYTATVTMKNTGNGTWFAGSSFQLRSQKPANNMIWGLSWVNVGNDVPPGAQYTFTIPVTAPAVVGAYHFQWQMVQDGSTWFGQLTDSLVSVVIDENLPPVPVTPPHLNNADAGTLPGELGVNHAGAATYGIPIEVPPGTAGLKPSLSLNYGSQGGNGPLGLGWSLGGLSSIHRCGKTIAQDGVNGRIRFDQGDRLCLDGQRLQLVNKPLTDANYWSDGAEFRTEIDSFSRITAYGTGKSLRFKVEAKDHRVMWFGGNETGANTSSNVKAIVTAMNVGTLNEVQPYDKGGALSWAIERIEDRAGNYIRFAYEQDGTTGEHWPIFIRYGGVGLASHAAVQFVYESRPDAWKRYVDDARNDLRSRISHIKTYYGANLDGDVVANGTLVRDYAFAYEQSATSGRSILKTAQVCARNPQSGAMDCLPATSFEWGKPDPNKTAGFVSRGAWPGGPILTTHNLVGNSYVFAIHPEYFAFADFENHGYSDVLEKRIASPVPPAMDSKAKYQWNHDDANPIAPGTLSTQYRYFHNTGSGFVEYKYKLSTGEAFAVLQTGDFDGDGSPDLVVATPSDTVRPAKICMSPLGKNGPQGSPGSTQVFQCAIDGSRPAIGDNTSYGLPHVLDVVGDGRSALYSRYDDQLQYAILCIQGSCVNDPGAPVNYLGYTYAVCCNPPSPLASYVRFDEMFDFAGTGKQQDVRWTNPHYVKQWCDDGGQTCHYVNAWQNKQPTVLMTGFRQPDSADAAYGAGTAVPYLYNEYNPKVCKQNDCSGVLPPYFFDAGSNAIGDFNGTGYSSPVFGFVEFGWGPAPDYQMSYSRAELTTCVSTGRRLDCGIRRKYSGDAYVAPLSVGNYIGDGQPSFRGRPTKLVGGMMQYGPAQMCRMTGDDNTGGTGTDDSNIVCEPWDGAGADGDYVFEMDLLGTGRTQIMVYHRGSYDDSHVWHDENAYWEVFEPVDVAKANQALDRIYQVTNGVGATSSVQYADGVPSGTVTRSGNSSLSYPQHVTAGTGKIVKKLIKDNGSSEDIETNYRYEDMGIDVAGRGSLGFAKVTSTDVKTGIVTTTTHSQQWPYVGMVLTSTVTAPGSTKPLSDTQNRLATKTLAQANGSTVWPFVAGSTVVRYDDGGEYMGTVTTSGVDGDDVQYSIWGNLLKMKVVSQGSAVDSNATFTTTTYNTYKTADKALWLVDLPSYQSVKKEQSGDTRTITRTKNITYEESTHPDRVKSEKLQDGDDALRLTIEYDRSGNPFGLVNTKTERWRDPLTALSRFRDTNTTYDANGRLPVTLTNALGYSESREYDYGSGAPTSHTDLNQLTTSWAVDGFGRALVELRPDANETRSYVKQCDTDCPAGAVVARITDQVHGSDRIAVPQVTYADSAGRVLQTKTWGFDGSVIVADQRYDDRGRLWETDQPHYTTDAAKLASRQLYDQLNRVIQLTTLDESGAEQTLKTDYQGMLTVITNAKGQGRTDKRDVLGQVREVVDAKQGVTKFGYDAFGNLSQTVDPNGNVITVHFDDLGHKDKLTDPDLGLIEYTPDPLGRTRKQVSPNERALGQYTENLYDVLDRLTQRIEPDLMSHWDYDTATMGVGQLAEAYTGPTSDKDYRRIHSYDALGRPSTTITVLTDANYKSTPGYDGWGRLMQQGQQRGSGETKVYTLRYNAYGYQSSIERPGLVLWKVDKQDAANRVTQSTLGNGLTQLHGYSAYSGRLESGMLKTAANAVRLQEGYTYDVLGNVMQRQQYWDTLGYTEDFHYDDLNRLDWSWVQGGTKQSFAYDAAGNLQTKTGLGTYTYPAQGVSAKRPHAVQSISGLTGSFVYDDNGNLLSGPSTTASRTATWTSFDMPITITKGANSSTFAYGPEHQRAKQIKNDGTTIIYAGAQEVETKAGVTTIKTYWPGGVGLEIDKTGQSGTQLRWTHVDRLGSPVSITDESGNLAEKLGYDAWGKRRNTNGIGTPDSLDGLVDNKGFTRHEMLDQLDLVHMNGRVYDPLTARFISGDPIVQELNNGQSYNRYSYVVNNPTNLTDPTGFARSCTAQTGSNIPICAGSDDVVVNHVDGSKEVLLGNGKGKTIESLGGRITKNGIEMVNAKTPGTGAGAGTAGPNAPVPATSPTVSHYDDMPPAWQEGLKKESLVKVRDDPSNIREDGWNAKSGKGPNDRGLDAENLVRADLEARGYRFVDRQVATLAGGRIYDLLMRGPDGRLFVVEAKSTMTGFFVDNPRQVAMDIDLMRHGATVVTSAGAAFKVQNIIYQGVDFSSHLGAGLAAWRAATIIRQYGGEVDIQRAGPKQ